LPIIISLILLSSCNIGVNKNFNPKIYARLNYLKIIKLINTPQEAAYYLKTHLNFKHTETCRSFKYIHQRRYGQCTEYAIAAAALLSDNNYPPLILHLYYRSKKSTHAFFLYQDKRTKQWGILAEKEVFLPIFKNPREICVALNKLHRDRSRIIAYKIHDLRGYNFIDGDKKDIYKQWHTGKKILLNQN